MYERGGSSTGLFGDTSAIAFVFAVIKVSASSGDGLKPVSAVVIRGTGLIPSMFSVILSIMRKRGRKSTIYRSYW